MGSSGTLQQAPQDQGRLLAGASPTHWVRAVGSALAVAVAYYFACRLSLLLLSDPEGVAVFWPAAGVSCGILIAMGRSARWPVVAGTMAATIVANLMGDRNVWSSIVFAVANAGEAALVAWLVERSIGSDVNFGRVRHVVGLLGAAIVATAISGIVGTAGFILFYNPSSSIPDTWLNWFMSDAIGIITVAPLVIGIIAAWREPPPRSEIVEGTAAIVLITALGLALVMMPLTPCVALLFPVLLWPASRCRPAFSSSAAFGVSILVVWAITFGVGQFGNPEFSMDERVMSAHATILGVALSTLVVAALFAERRDHAAVIAQSEARLQEALAAGRVTAFEWDLSTGLSQRSANAAKLLGLKAPQEQTASGFLTCVHPDDRVRLKTSVRELRPDNPSYALTFRFKRPDGQDAWFEEIAAAEFDGTGRLKRLKGLTVDVTARKRAQERQNILMAELDHRVKNALARVSVVVAGARRGSGSMEELVRTLQGRIQAMALAHTLLSESRWQGVGLRDLVRSQLAPYRTNAVKVSGVDAVLSPSATQAVAMVLHELVTNAAKYGGLSTPDSGVSVSWDQQTSEAGETHLHIVWQEFGGPPIDAKRTGAGFGTKLVRELIPHELGGTVDLILAHEGAHCKIVIPMGRA